MSLLIGFVAVEVLLRFLMPPIPEVRQAFVRDPHIPWKAKPLSVTWDPPPDGGGPPQEYRHNSLGFRDVEHAREKAPGVFRILGLGDSFTYGAGATFEETYLSRLGALLNARPGSHPRVEVINTGVPRYYPEPERMVLETYGPQFAPDLVTVGFLPNDVIDTYYGIDAIAINAEGDLISQEAASLGPMADWLYLHSYASRLVLDRFISYLKSRHHDPRYPEIFYPNRYHEKDWKTIEGEFGKMAGTAKELRVPLVLVYIPQQGPWAEKDDYPGKRLSAWGSTNGVGVVDVLPGMMRAAAATSQPLYYKTDGHCTPAGYAIVAQEMFAYFERNHIVP